MKVISAKLFQKLMDPNQFCEDYCKHLCNSSISQEVLEIICEDCPLNLVGEFLEL